MENDLKVVTEALIQAAWEQGLQTNYNTHYTDKSTESPLCKMRGEKGKSVHALPCPSKMIEIIYRKL